MTWKPLSMLGLMVAPMFFNIDFSGDESLDFGAYLSGNKVNIHWTAAPRERIKLYAIQRSRDGKTFEEIRILSDTGSVPESIEFLETDDQPMPGWSFYRIRHITTDDQEIYSHMTPVFYKAGRMQQGKIIAADHLETESFRFMNVSEFEGEELVLVLRNRHGEEVSYKGMLTINDREFSIPASDQLPKGNYTITACSRSELMGLDVIVR